MNAAQQRFGPPAASTLGKIEPQLNDMVRDFIAASPFCVMATASSAGTCDASPKGGAPGFVKVLDAKRLWLPDVAGNKLFQSYENIETNGQVGLVFLIPGCDWTVRVNGAARAVDERSEYLEGASPEVLWSDANTRVLQGLLIEVHEAYAHCPRAFLFAKLWDVPQIEASQAQDANKYWFKRYQQSRGRA